MLTTRLPVPPGQMVAAPEVVNVAAVGPGFTVTVTDPEPVTVQPLASVTGGLIKLYVVVAAGVTEMAAPLV